MMHAFASWLLNVLHESPYFNMGGRYQYRSVSLSLDPLQSHSATSGAAKVFVCFSAYLFVIKHDENGLPEVLTVVRGLEC